MPRFSANLGFLWTDQPLPDAIRAAKAAGFDAVECHAPFETPAEQVKAALLETGLDMLGINTRTKDFGHAAIPGHEARAQEDIAEALAYARAIEAKSVHVLSGCTDDSAARDTLLGNLGAVAQAANDITLLIEPLNAHDAPGYFLRTTDQARDILDDLGAPNVKLMFDCYHVARTEGDVIARMTDLLPIIGHIQFAGFPDRGPPDRGTLDYRAVFAHVDNLGWTRPLGAEYRPPGPTEASLVWMKELTV